VLLITLDSTAGSVRWVWFHSVKAKAVLTTASQRMMAQLRASSAGRPWLAIPAASRTRPPVPMLTTVTTSGVIVPARLMPRPITAESALAITPTKTMIRPTT